MIIKDPGVCCRGFCYDFVDFLFNLGYYGFKGFYLKKKGGVKQANPVIIKNMNTKEMVKPAFIIALILIVLIAGGSYLNKGADNAGNPEASPSNGVAGPSASNNPEVLATPDAGKPTAVTASEPFGKVIYWMNIISNKKNYKFEHYCDGSVKLYKNDANGSGLVPADSTYYYCIGRNQLFLNLDGEMSVIKDEVISGAQNAPIFTDIKLLSSGIILISYSPNACFTVNDCGVGMPNNYITIAFSIADSTFRIIKNYPSHGEAIWNRSGIKAIFYPETCGGAGCDEASVIGYDLTIDEAKDVSSEKAAYDSNMCGAGKNCWANCGSPDSVSGKCLSAWDSLRWVDDSKVSATIISSAGDKKETTFEF